MILVCPNGNGITYDNASAAENVVDHCTIDALNGIVVYKGYPKLLNNIIVNRNESGLVGIKYMPTGLPAFGYNNIFGFKTPYQGCSASFGATTYNPNFVDKMPFDYTLPITSPMKSSDQNGLEMGRWGPTYY